MRVLCLDQFASMGGGQRCLLDLMAKFSSVAGWQVHLGIAGRGPLEAAVRTLGVPFSILPSRSYTNGHKSVTDLPRYLLHTGQLARAIGRLVTAFDPTLLYVNGPRLIPASAIVARSRSLPLVFHCHSRPAQAIANSLLRTSLRAASAHVIACCRFAAEPLLHRLREDQISIVYNGVPATARYRPRRTIRRIAVLGRIEREKGQLDFVRAVRSLRDLAGYRFLVIGASTFSGFDYFESVIDESRGSRIEFRGWRDNPPAVLSEFDLLVVPSSAFDCTPRVIMEAFASGIPVVAFPSGGIPELVRDGETGFLAHSTTPEALAQRIRSVLSMNAEVRSAVITRAYQAWSERYRLERFQKEVMEVLTRAATPEEKRLVSTRSLPATVGIRER